jgi:hypothetical protein
LRASRSGHLASGCQGRRPARAVSAADRSSANWGADVADVRVPGWPRAVRRATAEVDHVRYDTREVDVFYIHHDLITEFWSFSEDQAATDRI